MRPFSLVAILLLATPAVIRASATLPPGPMASCAPRLSDAADEALPQSLLFLPGYADRYLLGLSAVTRAGEEVLALGPYQGSGHAALRSAAEKKGGEIARVAWAGEVLLVNTSASPGIGAFFRANETCDLDFGDETNNVHALSAAVSSHAPWLLDRAFLGVEADTAGLHLVPEWDGATENVRAGFVPSLALLRETLGRALPDRPLRLKGSDKQEMETRIREALKKREGDVLRFRRYLDRFRLTTRGGEPVPVGPERDSVGGLTLESLLATIARRELGEPHVTQVLSITGKFLKGERVEFGEWVTLQASLAAMRSLERLPEELDRHIEVWTISSPGRNGRASRR